MAFKFCPHCGEDVGVLADAGAAAAAPAKQSVVRREVTSHEVEQVWGLLPLPFHIVPFGVVVDANKQPTALACQDNDGKHWALAGGQVTLLGDVDGAEAAPLPLPTPQATKPPTVPEHICNTDGESKREARGGARYGS